jgi:hypothetical protein
MSTTAVPIQPLSGGVMTKLWIGVAACVVGATGLAFYGTQAQSVGGACGALAFVPPRNGAKLPILTASGLRFQTVRAGEGNTPTDADVALVGYKGSLTNGTVFDANERAPLPVGGVVPGFSEALKMMQRGGSYRVCIPGKLAYGAKSPAPSIPANATLLFSVDLLDFKSMAEVQQMQMQHQQQLQQQPQGPGSDGPSAK